MAPKSLLSIAALAALVGPTFAQSQIFGVNVRGNQVFQSNTATFVNSYTVLGASAGAFYGVDFDASATTLYAVEATTLEVFTIDLVTGVQTPTGALINTPSLSGLSADPNGSDWWLSYYDGVNTVLYRGNLLTGSFNLVGTISAGIIIDIAIDSQGNLYGFSISDDSLYSIDTTTGAGTVIGPVGLNGNFAQGMDFDWSTDTLYATIYTGGGTGMFCSLDLATGLATQLEDTFPLNAEMEMAVQQPSSGGPGPIGTNYCTATNNSTGVAGEISATGSTTASDNNVTLMASNLPPGQFGIFVTSKTSAFTPNVGSGNLCVGGSIGRYQQPGQIQQIDANGDIALMIDTNFMPQGAGLVPIVPGETWYFQAWHRDFTTTPPIMNTSNLTNGLEITFN